MFHFFNFKYQFQDQEDEEQFINSPEGHEFGRKLVCVRFPGNVLNSDKAIEKLGGIKEMSNVCKQQIFIHPNLFLFVKKSQRIDL